MKTSTANHPITKHLNRDYFGKDYEHTGSNQRREHDEVQELFSRLHRSYPFPCQMIDIDCMEWDKKHGRVIALYELTGVEFGEYKMWRATRQAAKKNLAFCIRFPYSKVLQVKAYLVKTGMNYKSNDHKGIMQRMIDYRKPIFEVEFKDIRYRWTYQQFGEFLISLHLRQEV